MNFEVFIDCDLKSPPPVQDQGMWGFNCYYLNIFLKCARRPSTALDLTI
jgi:hypothetical protein